MQNLNELVEIIKVVPLTLSLYLMIVFISCILGLISTYVLVNDRSIIKKILVVFISFEKGTPLIVQLFLLYFGIPKMMDSFNLNIHHLNPVIYAVLALSLNLSAFLGEIFKSGYLGIEREQIEAGKSIGYSNQYLFLRVIFPQGFKLVMLNINNLLIDEFKALSLVFSIGVVEIMGRGSQIIDQQLGVNKLSVYLFVASLYLVLSIGIRAVLRIVEKKLT